MTDEELDAEIAKLEALEAQQAQSLTPGVGFDTPGVGYSQNKPLKVSKIGRNDPCPCGSGLKWKKCGLINSPSHKN